MNANILVETEGLSRYEWLRYRKQGIGGSDVAAILGISKWNSSISLWLNKTNQTEDDTQENEAMEWGTIMEPVIRNHFAKVTGKTVVEVHAMLQHPEYPFMIADVDGLTTDDEGNPAILVSCFFVSSFLPFISNFFVCLEFFTETGKYNILHKPYGCLCYFE